MTESSPVSGNFVLTPVQPGVWTGKAGKSVTVSVSSSGNLTKMHDAAYPDDTDLPVSSNKATFTIASDGNSHDLGVGITPPASPQPWTMVEVGKDGSTQRLIGAIAGQPDAVVTIKPS